MKSLLALLEHTSGTQDSDVWLRHAARFWFAPDDTPFDTDPAWEELTGYVESASIARGGMSDHDVYKAGSVEIVVDNSDAIFHPLNPDSPYVDDMRPGKQLWVECDDDREYRDDFYRPDDASDVGTLDSGELWWQMLGLAEIDSYEFGFASTTTVGGDARAATVVDVGEGDGFVEFVVGTVAQDGMGVCFRWSNPQNGWYIRRDAANTRWRVCKLIDNVETVVTDVSGATAVGTKVRVDFAKDKVGPVTVDGVEVAASTATDDDFMFCSLVGNFADGDLTTARWASFRAGVAQRTLFRGFVDFKDGWTLAESSVDRHAVATIRGIDILGMVGTVELAEESAGVGAAELSGARVNRILDKTSVPDAWRDIDVGLYTVAATVHGDNALSELETVTLSEGGALMARANGRIWFGDRDSGIDRERTNGARFTMSDVAPADDEDWTPRDATRGTVWLVAPEYLTASGSPVADGGAPDTLTPAVDTLTLGSLTVDADEPGTATAFTYRAGTDSGPYLDSDTITDRMSSGASALTSLDSFSVAMLGRVNDWTPSSPTVIQWWSVDNGELNAPDDGVLWKVWDGDSGHTATAWAGDESKWLVVVVHFDPANESGYLEIGGYRYVNFTGNAPLSPTQFHWMNNENLASGFPFERGGYQDGALAWIVEGEFTAVEKTRMQWWAYRNYGAPLLPPPDVEFDHPDGWEDFASRILNKWQLTADGLTDVEADDSTSQSNFGIHAASRTGLVLDTQADLASLGTRLIAQFKDPTAGPKEASVDAHGGGARYYMAVRSEMRDRHRYQWRPRGFATPLSAGTLVESSRHEIVIGGDGQQRWWCGFEYLPAELVAFGDQTSFLVLDHPELAALDAHAWS